MTMWFLIIILTGGGAEQHIAIEMPTQTTCETIAQGYVHAASYSNVNSSVPDPFDRGTAQVTMQIDPMKVDASGRRSWLKS